MANVFSPNLDGDNVDASGRRKYGRNGTAQKVGPSSAVLLALGGWCGTAFRRRHYYENEARFARSGLKK